MKIDVVVHELHTAAQVLDDSDRKPNLDFQVEVDSLAEAEKAAKVLFGKVHHPERFVTRIRRNEYVVLYYRI